MTELVANCLSCGGEIRFKAGGSVVIVCPSCHSVVARTDRKLEDLGRVAELLETPSRLKLDMRGSYQGQNFTVRGRAQLRHPSGAVWDEWYVEFPGNRWGWLAEAQGRLFMTFETPIQGTVPPFQELSFTRALPGLANAPRLWVYEKDTATYVSAEGEIPYRLVPNARLPYADLAGPKGEFATLDFSGASPVLYLGHAATPEELGLPKTAAKPKDRVAPSTRLNCPQCGGALNLKAPDQAQRIVCPYCSSMLDINSGNLVYLKTLAPPARPPILQLGTKAPFENETFEVIAYLIRSCVVDQVTYYWYEYLLYAPHAGFRWLVHSDGHWTWVRSVHPGTVRMAGTTPVHAEVRFRRFQDAIATVEYVTGEVFWKVEQGETVEASDFVAPPEMLSREVSRGADGGEVVWSLGTYVPASEIKAKFKLNTIPRTQGIGPCQPFPHRGVIGAFGWLFLAACLVFGFLNLITRTDNVLQKDFEVPALPNDNAQKTVFSDKFDLRGSRSIQVTARGKVFNEWTTLDGELVPDAGGPPVRFALLLNPETPMSADTSSVLEPDGEVFIPAVPPGKYSLKLTVSWPNYAVPNRFSIQITQGHVRTTHFMLLLAALLVIPLFVGWRYISFESQRWSNSMYG